MGTGRLHLAVLPGLIVLSLSPAERCSGAAGVFMEPQLRARAGDSVLLPCLFLDPESRGWTLHKVDWLHKAGAGAQEEMVFFYYSNHAVPAGRFKKRVQWRGNISRWDGSILLQDLRVHDSGTYECELRLLQNSSVFKSRTVLLVSPAPRGREAAAAEDAAQPPRDSGFWPAVVGCGCVAVVVAFLAGLCVRKRFATITALERMGNSSSKNKAEEAIYSSIPGAEVPKAEQEAKKKRRAEDTYITMHPSHGRDNGVYVELAKRAIPTEWMAEGTQGDGQSQEPPSRSGEALPRPPEQQK
ncbi:PREDICTED: junctional adhesion molecule-like isoform X1 [Pseudopodoces humilis]|uniref:junctional adhesion molecule-like isoform X1 n=1 Tax=Pseudopodoces humilis TaxID=181119 RepID=UPI0006B818E5|nr:PREDICTED: junctional adhesion molecule-like isoform X1 [Pseudopodoces humilis]